MALSVVIYYVTLPIYSHAEITPEMSIGLDLHWTGSGL